ncbi:hypothetical protein HD806DRAFT_507302 [Xylariaceae sp. AK1471]|nr:hypothetical protein HD806DRAFT_507302 [Xylariaceae sp. AK1471]
MSVTRLSDDVEQPWNLIHKWQANATKNTTESQLPLVAQRYDLIIRLYKPVLKLLCFQKGHDVNQRRLKRAFETLLLWGQQYEVSAGELDRLIDRSWRLRRSVLRTLTSIGRALTDRLTPHIQQPLPEQLQTTSSLLRKAREEAIFLLTNKMESDQAGEGSSDDDSDTSSVFEVDPLSEIVEDLTSNVEHLMDLDALYDTAKEDTNLYEEEPVAKVVTSLASASSSAAKFYTEMIQMRFPEANYELLDYLGRANYYRFVRGSQQREKNEHQAEGDPETMGHAATTIDGSRFHDSGIGTSLHTGSYAETVMSFHHGNGSVVRIPPLPEEGKKGLPFSCIACGKKVIIRTNRAWKRHLFLDLEPFNCLETSCRHTVIPLGRRENWVEHLAVHHGYEGQWQSFQCSLCLEETGHGEANVTIHLEKHLQDIALTALPNNGDDGSEPESDEVSILSAPEEGEIHGKAVALFDFDRANDNELSLVEGQIIWVSYRQGQGWLVAEDPSTQESGLVPEEYVRLLRDIEGGEDILKDHISEDPNTSKDASTTIQAEHTTHTAALSSSTSNGHDQFDSSDGDSHASFQSAEANSCNRRMPSSYWSVPESQAFPELLRSYGSDWAAIATHMRTKTAVMVKNYYTRRRDTKDWGTIVQEADSKKARGKQKSMPTKASPPLSRPPAVHNSGTSFVTPQHPPTRPSPLNSLINGDQPPRTLDHSFSPVLFPQRSSFSTTPHRSPPVSRNGMSLDHEPSISSNDSNNAPEGAITTIAPTAGDAVLILHLDGGRRGEVKLS